MVIQYRLDDADVLAALKKVAERGADMRRVMESVGQDMVTKVDLEFREERDPWGKAWKPLRPMTLAARRRHGRDARILRDTGLLANSFFYRATKERVTIGTARNYAKTHQFGDRANKIPARKMLPLAETGAVDLPNGWRQDILGLLAAHIKP